MKSCFSIIHGFGRETPSLCRGGGFNKSFICSLGFFCMFWNNWQHQKGWIWVIIAFHYSYITIRYRFVVLWWHTLISFDHELVLKLQTNQKDALLLHANSDYALSNFPRHAKLIQWKVYWIGFLLPVLVFTCMQEEN